MKGLLLKDFYILRDNLLILFIVLLAVGAGMSYLTSAWVLITTAAIIMSMIVPATISSDKTSQWHRFAATLPVSRKQLVASKYFMYGILCLGGLLAGALVSLPITLMKGQFEMDTLLIFVFTGIILCLVSGGISIPCYFLLSEDKSVVAAMLSYMATTGLFVAGILVANAFFDIKNNLVTAGAAGAVMSIGFYILSLCLSQKYLPKKDL